MLPDRRRVSHGVDRGVANDQGAITDVVGIRVGHWTSRRRATGCTVVLAPDGAVGGFHGAGGAPGTIDTHLLRPENTVQQIHAVLVSGGSAHGLAAAAGVREVGYIICLNIVALAPISRCWGVSIGVRKSELPADHVARRTVISRCLERAPMPVMKDLHFAPVGFSSGAVFLIPSQPKFSFSRSSVVGSHAEVGGKAIGAIGIIKTVNITINIKGDI